MWFYHSLLWSAVQGRVAVLVSVSVFLLKVVAARLVAISHRCVWPSQFRSNLTAAAGPRWARSPYQAGEQPLLWCQEKALCRVLHGCYVLLGQAGQRWYRPACIRSLRESSGDLGETYYQLGLIALSFGVPLSARELLSPLPAPLLPPPCDWARLCQWSWAMFSKRLCRWISTK